MQEIRTGQLSRVLEGLWHLPANEPRMQPHEDAEHQYGQMERMTGFLSVEWYDRQDCRERTLEQVGVTVGMRLPRVTLAVIPG